MEEEIEIEQEKKLVNWCGIWVTKKHRRQLRRMIWDYLYAWGYRDGENPYEKKKSKNQHI